MLRNKIILFAAALIAGTSAMAQKVAHVNLDSIISLMPESKKATDMLSEYGKTLEKELKAMDAELGEKMAAYNPNDPNVSALVMAKREAEIQDLQQRIEMFRQQAQQDYQVKTTEISKPVYEKARKAVQLVAKESGYSYVLDSSTGLLLVAEPGDDIFAAVKKKLDTMPEVMLPGSAKNTGTPPQNTTNTAKGAGK